MFGIEIIEETETQKTLWEIPKIKGCNRMLRELQAKVQNGTLRCCNKL